jgi:hypothetical protein
MLLTDGNHGNRVSESASFDFPTASPTAACDRFVSVKIHLLGVISTREAGEYIVRRADDRVTAYIKAIFDQGQPIRCLGPPDLSLAA